jgi:hypothetical protein
MLRRAGVVGALVGVCCLVGASAALAVGTPTATISTPLPNQTYNLNQVVPTSFSCNYNGHTPVSCMDSNGVSSPSGSPVSGQLVTSAAGLQSYGVSVDYKQGSMYLDQFSTINYTVLDATPTSNPDSPPTITGTAKVGQALTVDTTGAFTGANLAYSYQWQDCTGVTCTNVASASGGTSSSYTLQSTDVGDTIEVVVTATNDGGSTAATAAATSAVEALPNPTPTPTPPPTPTPAPVSTATPVISGAVAVGHVLSVSTGSWSGTTSGFQYQWLRDGVPISGSTHSTYTVQTADQGHALTCTVTAADGSTTSTSTSSSTSSGVTIPISNVQACPQPTGQLGGTTLGPITLGLTRTRARRMLPRFNTPSYHTDNFCLSGSSGIRVGYASAKLLGSTADARQAAISGRVVLALTANPFYTLDGVKPGTSLASAAHHLKLDKVIRLGLNNWYVIPAATSNGVLKVRHGMIQEVGVANKRLTATRAAQTRLLISF